MDAGEAQVLQALDQHVPVALVVVHIGHHVHAPLDDPLIEVRGADMAQGPGRAGADVHHVFIGGAAAADGQVAHPLAGDGQGLGVGVADQGIVVEVHQVGDLHAVVGQLPVGLVGEQEDGMAELLLGGLHGVGQTLDGLPGVDDAGGVVGGVEDHHPGLLGQRGFEGG